MRLTRQEIYIVLFLLSALVVGTAVKHWRHRGERLPPVTVTAKP